MRQHLVGKGVAAERLISRGYGPSRPVMEQATTEDEHAQGAWSSTFSSATVPPSIRGDEVMTDAMTTEKAHKPVRS